MGNLAFFLTPPLVKPTLKKIIEKQRTPRKEYFAWRGNIYFQNIPTQNTGQTAGLPQGGEKEK